MADPYRSPGVSLKGPPREVPLALRLSLLFGGPLGLMGWVFLLLGSVFGWVFLARADFTAWFPDADLAARPGVVIRSEGTASSENRKRIFETRTSFRDAAGVEREAVSYGYVQHPPGEEVTVDVPAARPDRARIRGERLRPFGPSVVFVALFPFIGLGFAVVQLRRGRRAIALLCNGRLARGTRIDKKATSVRINKRTVYAFTFSFEADDGKTYQVSARTERTELLEDDPTEPLVYLPWDPRQATLLDHLPGAPVIRPDGSLAARNPAGAAILLLPILAVAINAVLLLSNCTGR